MLLDHHLSNMQADAVQYLDASLTGQHSQAGLQKEREANAIRRLGEDQEERITRSANFLSVFEISEDFSHESVMLKYEFNGPLISQVLFQLG